MRFADDFVVALEDRHSGKRLLDVLGKRLGRYGLTLHETKTRYVDFRRRRPYGRHWGLARRSRLRRLNWDRMNELLKRHPLPSVTFMRSWQRFLSEPVR